MLRLRTLGSFGVTDASGAPVSLPPHRFALLALLAASGDRGMGRDKLLAYLWPESTPAKARASLEQMLHALRVSLDNRSILLGNPLRLDPAFISSDVGDFRNAVAAGDRERAAALYEGPFLDGFYLPDVSEFEQWVASERSRLEAQYVNALEKLATEAAARGDHVQTIEWVRSLGTVAPATPTAARRFMEALVACGDRDAALEYAAIHAARIRTELGTEPDASVAALAEQLRAGQPIVRAAKVSSDDVELPVPVTPPRRKPTATYRVAVIAAAVLVLLGGWAWFARSNGPQLDPNVIAVVPFSVKAHDSSYNYLREGTLDYLRASLTGDRLPRTVDSRTVLAAWYRAAGIRGQVTEEQSLRLAKQLGAGLVLSGSFIITPERSVLTASLLDVRSGREVLTHRDEAAGEQLRLIDRLTRALLAQTAQTAGLATPVLSESLAAVREYLAGVRAARENQWVSAGQHYKRALAIDSAFAHVALKQWEAVLEGSAFPTPIGPPFIDPYFNLAWSLRNRLSEREQLYLKGLGTYYLHRDEASTAAALEAAAHAAPDDAKVWTSWGRRLTIFGRMLERRADWLRHAAEVLDSAIALDSTDAVAVRYRMFVALTGRRRDEILRYLRLLEQRAPNGDDTDALRWAAAHILNAEVALRRLRARLAALSAQSVYAMGHVALIEGLPLADVQEALELRQAQSIKTAQVSVTDAEWLFQILAARGRVQAALAVADSVMRTSDRRLSFGEFVIRQALLEPGVGYESVTGALARLSGDEIAHRFRQWYPSRDRSLFCLTQAFRTAEGDTSQVRAAVDHVRRIADSAPPLTGLRTTRGGSCPDLLEALTDLRRHHQADFRALHRLDSLLSGGLFWDRTATTAAVWLARVQDSLGLHAAGLATSRRQNHGDRDYQVAVWPAILRLEGRLAATVGDTLGAIRAYRHYLTLRDKPDPGPMANEVAAVRAHLAQLQPRSRR